MKVRYIGDYCKVRLHKGKVYEVLSVENEWYEIFGEDEENDFYLPQFFEIIEE